jgi:hypothetical protein
MKIEEINQSKVPIVRINKGLDKFNGKILFPEKLELANKMLENAKLPQVSKDRK